MGCSGRSRLPAGADCRPARASPAAARPPLRGAGHLPQCRVIARGALSPLTPEERESLTAEELEKGVRLACLTMVEGAAEITVPPAAAMAVIEAAGETPDYPLDPPAGEYGVAVDIGTTTLVVSLYRLGQRTPLGTLCRKNTAGRVRRGRDFPHRETLR